MGTKDLNQFMSVMVMATIAAGCNAAVETAPAGLTAHAFLPATVAIEAAGDGHRFVFAGTVADQPAHLFVEVDPSTFEHAVGSTLEISGEAFFDVSFPAFEAHPENSGRVLRAWVWGGCADCAVDARWQGVSGHLRLDSVDAGRLTGHVLLQAEGDIPRAGLRDVSVTIDGPFEVALPASALPAEVEPEPVVEEPAPIGEPTEPEPTTPVEPAPGPVGPLATPTSDIVELTLTTGWGVDLARGELVHKANFKNSDLFVTAGHPYPKLTPGGATATKSQPLRWFQSTGGLVQTFDSLNDVPLELPTEADGSKSIVSAKPYLGFIVKANLSDAYARVWIQSASQDHVTIQFQLLAPAP